MYKNDKYSDKLPRLIRYSIPVITHFSYLQICERLSVSISGCLVHTKFNRCLTISKYLNLRISIKLPFHCHHVVKFYAVARRILPHY